MILSSLFGVSILNLAVLFAIVFIGSLGFPGGSVWLVSSGAIAGTYSELLLIMIVGAAAAMLGYITAYELARKFSFRFTDWLKRFKFYRKNESTVKEKFNESEFYVIFFSRFFIIMLCAVTSYVSGLVRLRRMKFLSAMIPGEILFGASFPLLGFIFKETWNDYTNLLTDAALLVLLAVIGFFVIKALVNFIRRYIKRSKSV